MNDEQMKGLEAELKALLPGIPFTIGGRDRSYFRRAIVEFDLIGGERIAPVCKLLTECMEGRWVIANCILYQWEAQLTSRWQVTARFRDKDFRFDI